MQLFQIDSVAAALEVDGALNIFNRATEAATLHCGEQGAGIRSSKLKVPVDQGRLIPLHRFRLELINND